MKKPNKDIEKLKKEGFKLSARGFSIFFLESQFSKIIVSVGKSFGCAVDRNFIRRKFQSFFREKYEIKKNKPGFKILILVRRSF